jgi:hypothetical protein
VIYCDIDKGLITMNGCNIHVWGYVDYMRDMIPEKKKKKYLKILENENWKKV